MNSRGNTFVVVLLALALVGGAMAFSVNLGQVDTQEASIFSWWQKKPAAVSETQDTSAQILAGIERELGLAQKSGGMSPENYRSIESKLKALEQKKIDTKKARALLAKVAVGGQSAKVSPSQGTSPAQTLADIERQLMTAGKSGSISPSSYNSIDSQLSSLEKKKVDTKKARSLLAKLKAGVQSASPLSDSGSSVAKQSGPVTWEYYLDTDTWKPSRTPPSCGKLEFKSPVDLSKAMAILYPGQIRGKSIADFKAHGGFLLKESTEVRVPFDGYVMQGARFLQNGIIQYGFEIVSECGIMMRFGHLYKLPPKFQELAEKMRPAVEMDSRTTDLRPYAVRVSKGELLATEVGIPGNAGMDWGLVDIRQVNESAKNPEYRAAHKFQGRYDNYALCWLDYLPADEQAIARALPGGDGVMGKTSDYCK